MYTIILQKMIKIRGGQLESIPCRCCTSNHTDMQSVSHRNDRSTMRCAQPGRLQANVAVGLWAKVLFLSLPPNRRSARPSLSPFSIRSLTPSLSSARARSYAIAWFCKHGIICFGRGLPSQPSLSAHWLFTVTFSWYLKDNAPLSLSVGVIVFRTHPCDSAMASYILVSLLFRIELKRQWLSEFTTFDYIIDWKLVEIIREYCVGPFSNFVLFLFEGKTCSGTTKSLLPT